MIIQTRRHEAALAQSAAKPQLSALPRSYALKVRTEVSDQSSTVFDPPPESLEFDSVQRAREWCEKVNRWIGYERFTVVESRTAVKTD